MQVCDSGMCRHDGVPTVHERHSAFPNIQRMAAASAPGAETVSGFYFEILCYPVVFGQGLPSAAWVHSHISLVPHPPFCSIALQ